MVHWYESPLLRRAIALVVGPLYLVGLSLAAGGMTQRHPLICFPWVVAGGSVIMAVLVVFGVRAHLYNESQFRFGLSTVFLVTIPLGLYLASLRWVLANTDAPFGREVGAIMFLAFTYISVSTVVLLFYVEAIVCCGAKAIQWRARKRDKDGR